MSAPERSFVPVLLRRTVIGGVRVVVLAGELDLACIPVLDRVLARAPARATPNVAVDLRRVRFIDCSILHPFVAAHDAARSHGGCLRVVATRGEPLTVLRATGLTGLFCLHTTLRDATAPFCARHAAASNT
jgi:anti-anti-sigma factor